MIPGTSSQRVVKNESDRRFFDGDGWTDGGWLVGGFVFVPIS